MSDIEETNFSLIGNAPNGMIYGKMELRLKTDTDAHTLATFEIALPKGETTNFIEYENLCRKEIAKVCDEIKAKMIIR